jgi:hypothetical protein
VSERHGIHRAIVVSNADPAGRKRLLVESPGALDAGPRWAEACVPHRSRAIPPVGSIVWIQFEAGDVARPVWIGVRPS